MNREEVLKLAKLARIQISDAEAETLSHEFDAILKYVGEIKDAKLKNVEGQKSHELMLKNTLRVDTDPHETGIFTEVLLNAAPAREENFVKVKKIL